MRHCKNFWDFTSAAGRTRWPSGAAGTPAASGTSAAAPWRPGGTAEPRFAAAAVLPSLAAALCLATAIADVEGETMRPLFLLTWGPVEVMFGWPVEDPSRILTRPASSVQAAALNPRPQPSSPPTSHAQSI